MDHSLLVIVETNPHPEKMQKQRADELLRETINSNDELYVTRRDDSEEEEDDILRNKESSGKNMFKMEARKPLYSRDFSEIYHIGIIDYLQTWDSNKKCENFMKTKFLSKKNVSAVPPEEYSQRFQDFTADKVFKNQNKSKNYDYLFDP